MTTAANATQAEANKDTVRQMLAQFNANNVDGFVEHLAEHYVRHCQAMPQGLQEIRGPAAMGAWVRSNSATFPDWQEEIECLVAEGDFVAWRSVGRATQAGPMGPFPATGLRVTVVIIGMHRFEGAKVAETWTSWDNLAVLRQLGLVPGQA